MAADLDVDVDYYQLLGIESTASDREINTAYRQKSLKVHPDRVRYPLSLSQVHLPLTSIYRTQTIPEPQNSSTISQKPTRSSKTQQPAPHSTLPTKPNLPAKPASPLSTASGNHLPRIC
jgi:hypothetical protein